MKVDKKKVVFVSIIVIVLIFIVSYTMLVLTDEELPATLDQTLVPELQEEQEVYTSKMKALDALKEERERSIPSVYSEKYLDSLDSYAPAIEEEREWMVDSTVRIGIVEHKQRPSYEEDNNSENSVVVEKTLMKPRIAIEDLSSGHGSFFLSAVTFGAIPKLKRNSKIKIKAEVNGSQTLRTGDRLELILSEDAQIQEEFFPKNTLLYGFVSLQLNRIHIKITQVDGRKAILKAYDLQDSNEGIYVKNSFRAEAGREVLDDIVQDVNIAGLPQIGGIKNIFRRNNRNIQVTILDQYQLILKAEQ